MAAYYNEIEPYAAQWLRNLIAAGHIAPGDVDERDIRDVRPDDLRGYKQCHFFAGLGGWSHALRLAEWPDARPIWTGSCPCQPFSAAGQGGGFDDERHLWPAFFHLIEQCRPDRVVGEQVASPGGLAWFDLVSDDLEAAGYAASAVDLCAAGVGSPHIRQRLYWVADRNVAGHAQLLRERRRGVDFGRPKQRPQPGLEFSDDFIGLADTATGGRREQRSALEPGGFRHADGSSHAPCGLGDAKRAGLALGVGIAGTDGRESGAVSGQAVVRTDLDAAPWAGATHGFWGNPDWLFCRDGKWRPVESGTFPLADGVPARVGKLRAYGNAIVPQVAAAFVRGLV